MAQSTFSLSWDSYRNNICHGLSSLQQNEEFVDMTLAADGHHVKVHQMIIALASPYLKQLIASAACQHPVIFLNKISYKTLSAILEYIYTGEVIVSMEILPELVQAAQELHIKGLEDMDVKSSVKSNHRSIIPKYHSPSEGEYAVEIEDGIENMDEEVYFEVTASDKNPPEHKSNYTLLNDGIPKDSKFMHDTCEGSMVVEDQVAVDTPTEKRNNMSSMISNTVRENEITELSADENLPTTIQYTVSNQGSLQMILNRYVYYLKHSNRNNSRQWRCVDYLNARKCPALVFTKDDVVVQRISAHSHPFHDKRILKKVYANAVFSAIQEAEKEGINMKTKVGPEVTSEDNASFTVADNNYCDSNEL